MKPLFRFLLTSASLLLFLLLVLSMWFTMKWYVEPVTNIKQPATFEVSPGISTTKLVDQLYQDKLINSPHYLLWLAKLKGDITHIKIGEYQIKPGQTANALLTDMIKGKVVYQKITVIEGWTFQQLMKALNQNPYVTHKLQNKTPEEIMIAIGHPGILAEGAFYPDTYFFSKGTSDTRLLKIAYNLMEKKLSRAWQTRAPNLPYKSPEEALIVASMVEKEARLAKERPLIAGVMLKRLETGMRLQIDATVIYGTGANYLKPVTRTDLQTDSPYNTYTRYGLPPTPISLPSESSIQAALNPQITDAFYYVAKGDGSHVFSKHLKGHNQAVSEYREMVKKETILVSAGEQSISPELLLSYWQKLGSTCCPIR